MTTSRSRTKISSFCNNSRRKPSRNWYQRSLTSYNPGALDLKVRGQIFWKQGDRILKLIQQVCILGGWGVHFNYYTTEDKKTTQTSATVSHRSSCCCCCCCGFTILGYIFTKHREGERETCRYIHKNLTNF